jgi:hypothetical protein
MADVTQSYATHRKFVPAFHYVMAPILLGNVLVQAYGVVRGPNPGSVWQLLVAIAIAIGAFYGRLFALAAQDRVIRLEERLRMQSVLPPDLQARVGELTRDQLIALRFAGDSELAVLTARVLKDDIQKRDEIKKLVTQWRADTHQL